MKYHGMINLPILEEDNSFNYGFTANNSACSSLLFVPSQLRQSMGLHFHTSQHIHAHTSTSYAFNIRENTHIYTSVNLKKNEKDNLQFYGQYSSVSITK